MEHTAPDAGSDGKRARDGSRPSIALTCLAIAVAGGLGQAGTLTGVLRDPNWYAQRQGQPFGVGYYEYAVNANGTGLSSTGGSAATDVHGQFSMPSLASGTYTVASWDVWWRSAFAFGVAVPAAGSSAAVDLRLHATMWGYPVFWDETGYYEFGQTFVATGPITMIMLRCPHATTYRVTVHENGPGGAQVGVERSLGGRGDHRPIYGYGDMPTQAGRTYYLRVRTSSPSIGGVLSQMDPRPDYSDPMPGGCLHVGGAQGVTADPERDLGVVVMADDDGLLTNLFARQSGGKFSGVTRAGQTFVARGVNLVSAAFWLADPAGPVYEVRLYAGGPGGTAVGPAKRGRPARRSADPEMIVTWTPGECPLEPGGVYYLEVTRVGGGTFNEVYVNTGNPFPFGAACRDGVEVAGTDLAGTILEETEPGSATRLPVRFTAEPAIADADRSSDQLTVRWRTDVPSIGRIAYAAGHPPYTGEVRELAETTDHAVTLTGLRPHTLHHYQVTSEAPDRRPAVSRDFVICTRPVLPNLLRNPGFEEGSGSSPRTLTGWSRTGDLDIKVSDGTWFWGLPPREGAWLLEGAVNGAASDATVYQKVTARSGRAYTFSAWVTTWYRENDQWKYDVWDNAGRLSYVRLGIDPTGGTSPTASTVRWTPRFYSHLRYANVALRATARASAVTVFVRMKGDGGQWHLYGVDDCALTETPPDPTRFTAVNVSPESTVRLRLEGEPGFTNVVEVSSDLGSWVSLTNLLNSTGVIQWADPGPLPSGGRFYRAVIP